MCLNPLKIKIFHLLNFRKSETHLIQCKKKVVVVGVEVEW